MRPPSIIGGSPPFSRRGAATAIVRVRPPVASYLLSAAPTPSPPVRSFRGVAHSLAHSPRSLARPLSPIIVARSFARFDRPSLSLSLSRSRRSFILTASNAIPFSLCLGKLKHFCREV